MNKMKKINSKVLSSVIVGFFDRFFGFYGSALLATSCLILAFFVSFFITGIIPD